jgi:hypothetical protein
MLRSHLVALLERYLNQQSSVGQVGEWLLGHLQEILDSGDRQAIHLANQVDADLVELSEGLLDETLLRERFQHYLFTANHVVSSYLTHAYSESDVMFSPVGVPGAEVTIHFRHVVVA